MMNNDIEKKCNDISVAAQLDTPQQQWGPGAKLKRAREIANLPLEEVAQRLYLTTNLLAAIENDDYSKAPSITFIKGYLRAYARLVNINPNEVITNFDQLAILDDPALISTQELYKRRGPILAKKTFWFYVSLIVFVILIAMLGWFGEKESSATTLNSNERSSEMLNVTTKVDSTNYNSSISSDNNSLELKDVQAEPSSNEIMKTKTNETQKEK